MTTAPGTSRPSASQLPATDSPRARRSPHWRSPRGGAVEGVPVATAEKHTSSSLNVDASGHVVGTAWTAAGGLNAIFRSGGATTDLATLGGAGPV